MIKLIELPYDPSIEVSALLVLSSLDRHREWLSLFLQTNPSGHQYHQEATQQRIIFNNLIISGKPILNPLYKLLKSKTFTVLFIYKI